MSGSTSSKRLVRDTSLEDVTRPSPPPPQPHARSAAAQPPAPFSTPSPAARPLYYTPPTGGNSPLSRLPHDPSRNILSQLPTPDLARLQLTGRSLESQTRSFLGLSEITFEKLPVPVQREEPALETRGPRTRARSAAAQASVPFPSETPPSIPPNGFARVGHRIYVPHLDTAPVLYVLDTGGTTNASQPLEWRKKALTLVGFDDGQWKPCIMPVTVLGGTELWLFGGSRFETSPWTITTSPAGEPGPPQLSTRFICPELFIGGDSVSSAESARETLDEYAEQPFDHLYRIDLVAWTLTKVEAVEQSGSQGSQGKTATQTSSSTATSVDWCRALQFHTLDALDGCLVVFGGIFSGEIENDVYLYEIASGQWKMITAGMDTPRPRCGHASVVHDNAIWYFGGLVQESRDRSVSNELFCLRLSSGSKRVRWTKIVVPSRGTGPQRSDLFQVGSSQSQGQRHSLSSQASPSNTAGRQQASTSALPPRRSSITDLHQRAALQAGTLQQAQPRPSALVRTSSAQDLSSLSSLTLSSASSTESHRATGLAPRERIGASLVFIAPGRLLIANGRTSRHLERDGKLLQRHEPVVWSLSAADLFDVGLRHWSTPRTRALQPDVASAPNPTHLFYHDCAISTPVLVDAAQNSPGGLLPDDTPSTAGIIVTGHRMSLNDFATGSNPSSSAAGSPVRESPTGESPFRQTSFDMPSISQRQSLGGVAEAASQPAADSQDYVPDSQHSVWTAAIHQPRPSTSMSLHEPVTEEMEGIETQATTGALSQPVPGSQHQSTGTLGISPSTDVFGRPSQTQPEASTSQLALPGSQHSHAASSGVASSSSSEPTRELVNQRTGEVASLTTYRSGLPSAANQLSARVRRARVSSPEFQHMKTFSEEADEEMSDVIPSSSAGSREAPAASEQSSEALRPAYRDFDVDNADFLLRLVR